MPLFLKTVLFFSSLYWHTILFIFTYCFLHIRVISLHIILPFLTLADMCKSSFATEEKPFRGDKVDSVVLRIMIQQDNCICRVTIDIQIRPISIGLRKYNGIASSTPVEKECGHAFDITHIPDISTGYVIVPIEFIDNVDIRNIPLLLNSTLEFKSRVINGSFTRG